MQFVDALKWTLLHRGISLVSLFVGLSLAGAGIVLGLGDVVETLANDPSNPGAALEAGNPIISLVFLVAGIAVWLLGKSYALYLTMPSATGKAAADEFDMKQVRSEVLDALDDRLATIEDDLEATRRSVAELKRREHATSFEENEAVSSAIGDSSTSSNATAAEPISSASTGSRSSGVEPTSSGDSSAEDWELGDDQQPRDSVDPSSEVDSETSDDADSTKESKNDPLS